MNAEYMQQIYGGEISDHIKMQTETGPEISKLLDNGDQLTTIYNSQVKSKGAVNVTNSVLAFNPRNLFERPVEDPITASFKNTLNRVASEIGLTDADGIQYRPEYNPMLRDQSSDDLNQANDAVLRALQELKTLGEL